MEVSIKDPLSPKFIFLLIVLSGFATLSWEAVWQIKSTLALGVSAWGTAITLAVTMGGMSLGGFLMGHTLHKYSSIQPLRLYSALECIIGFSGLCLNVAFHAIEKLDTWAYAETLGSASLTHILGITAVLGVPTICMGATLPVFGLIAKQFQVSIAKLYSLNTFGGVGGVLFAALVLIPSFGITCTIMVIAGLNMAVGVSAWLLVPGNPVSTEAPDRENIPSPSVPFRDMLIVSITGFATFMLEIAWFRSLATMFPNTTDVFAIMLACVLIALGLASKDIPKLKQQKKSLGIQVSLAGILILLATPLIARLSIVSIYTPNNIALALHINELVHSDTFVINGIAIFLYAVQFLVLFFATCLVIIPPIKFLGIAFPWLLDNQHSSRNIGKLYAINTFSAIIGALGAAWFFLPTIGFTHTAWLTGALVVVAGCLLMPAGKRLLWGMLGIVSLIFAGSFGVGDYWRYVQEYHTKLIEFIEGPEATVSIIEYKDGARRLFIDSSSASGESAGHTLQESYMTWMGRLPMLLHPFPKNALVICFGTGQTANAVRKENPESLDIVDINPNIFKMAPYFKSNENVLHDPRVKAIVMDGRAYLRRTQKTYDIITLEPMPPSNAGVNALYSKEFYELARNRLSAKGIIAQWLPFHAVAPHSAASIAKTFISVFPNAILWITPESKDDAILLGTKDDSAVLTASWPGFSRMNTTRTVSQKEIQQYIVLNAQQLQRYGDYGEVISDDNQLLAYGKALYSHMGLTAENAKLLHRVNENAVIP